MHPTLRALQKSLPSREFAALSAWHSTFYPYQRKWLLDWSDFAILNKARQIGASFTHAGSAALWSAILGETTTVISKGQTEADEVVKSVGKHADVLAMLGSRWARKTRDAASKLTFASGGEVIALPSTSGGRSFSGNVLLDEFAYHEHPEEVWDGAAAVVMHGFKLRVMSTPNGVGNLFHELWANAQTSWTKHEVTIDQARADGLAVDDAKCWEMAHGDARIYDQLFRCKFLDSAQQYIPSHLIDGAIADVPTDARSVWDGETFAGLDIGRMNDLTCLVIVRVDARGVHWVQHIETIKRTEEADLDRLITVALGPTWRCVRICVDATGMGAFPASRIAQQYGHQKVEPVEFGLKSKEALATTLYQRLVDRAHDDKPVLRLPREQKELRDDIASLRRIITAAGNVRYDAPTTTRGHADRAWALALALHACSRPPSTVALT